MTDLLSCMYWTPALLKTEGKMPLPEVHPAEKIFAEILNIAEMFLEYKLTLEYKRVGKSVRARELTKWFSERNWLYLKQLFFYNKVIERITSFEPSLLVLLGE